MLLIADSCCPGCGGFVVNTNHQVLVVQERFADNPHWKFPGGLAMAGKLNHFRILWWPSYGRQINRFRILW